MTSSPPRLVVRALTAFLPARDVLALLDSMRQAHGVLVRLQSALEDAGFMVQTRRASTVAFPLWETQGRPVAVVVRALQEAAPETLLNLGQVDVVRDGEGVLESVPQLLASFPVYASVQVLPFGEKVVLGRRVWAAARLIHRLARVGLQGEANTRFAAAVGVPPYVPFFPASYAPPGETVWRWAVALETGGLLYWAFQQAGRPQEAEALLLSALEEQIDRMTQVLQAAAGEDWARFRGYDLSWAPFPEDDRSVARALQAWGLRIGWHGTVALAGWLTRLLHRVRVPARTGYFGLMLPVLEDPGLADALAEGTLDTRTLLMASAVCAVGLDTVPLPGSVTEGQLAAVLWDVAVPAARLGKPLTARLVPIPGCRAGGHVPWKKPFFITSVIPELPARAVPPLGEDAVLDLR